MFTELDDTAIYYAALALNPGYRWSWFQDKWRDNPDWVERAMVIVQNIWNRRYKHKEQTPVSPTSSSPSLGDKRPIYHDPFEHDAFKKRAVEEGSQARAVRVANGNDEYTAWCADETQKMAYCPDPIQYWYGLRFQYPRLSEMALDFLTVQPMSAECERLFSAGRRLITQQRHNLDAMVVGICMCLRSWYRSGLIPELDSGLVDKMEKTNVDALLGIPEDGGQQRKAATVWLDEPEEAFGTEEGDDIVEIPVVDWDSPK